MEDIFESKKFKLEFSSSLRTTDSAFFDIMFSSRISSEKSGMSLSARICSKGRGRGSKGERKGRREVRKERKERKGEREKGGDRENK